MSADEIELNCRNLKSEFSRLKDICYLDHVGAGLYADSQIDAVTGYLKNNLLGNPHSLNLSSKYCHDAVDQIRFQILEHFNVSEDEYSIVFTSGTTAALKSIVEWFDWENTDDASSTGSFVYLRDNHTSVLGLREIATQQNAEVHCLEHGDAFKEFKNSPVSQQGHCANALFVYPAQCNFSGCKYPLTWIEKLHRGSLDDFVTRSTKKRRQFRWFCLLDAASYVPTSKLDLSRHKPDFVTFSFYKMFGYPTGLGALLIRNSSEHVLSKKYYGGGTVLIALSDERFHVKRPTLHEWCEDGTVNYLSIVSLRHGFDALKRLGGSMDDISNRVFRLTQYLHEKLLMLHHSNGSRVVEIYRDTDYSDQTVQGNIVNFNLLRSSGEYIGYLEVLHIANSFGIHIRTGCFCNPGACQRHLKLTNENLMKNFQGGHTCADNIDLIDGRPTGSIRVSFGYMSGTSDADKLIEMIMDCFVSRPAVIKIPANWLNEARVLKSKFENDAPIECHVPSKPYNGVQRYTDPTNPSRTKCLIDAESALLTKIFVYPIKSCGAYSVPCYWPVTRTGLKYDREWMIISADGVVLTQKRVPQMCLIMPDINRKEEVMVLKFVGEGDPRSTVCISLNDRVTVNANVISICQSKVCDDRVQVTDCGDEVANWLEACLNEPGVRLVKLLARNKRTDTFQPDRSLSLVNHAQYLLITEPSVKWLISQTPNVLDTEFDEMLRRFRSNLVITGQVQPLNEFEWDEMHIGPVVFKVEGACNRCQIICVNQSSGEKNREPLIALSAALKGRIKFGIYLRCTDVNASSVLTIDDSVLLFRYK